MENENTELVYLLVLLILGEQTLTTMEESMWCSFMHWLQIIEQAGESKGIRLNKVSPSFKKTATPIINIFLSEQCNGNQKTESAPSFAPTFYWQWNHMQKKSEEKPSKQPRVSQHASRCRTKKILVISSLLNPWLQSWGWCLLGRMSVGGQQKGLLKSSLPRLV